jgi:hypothetical protein
MLLIEGKDRDPQPLDLIRRPFQRFSVLDHFAERLGQIDGGDAGSR